MPFKYKDLSGPDRQRIEAAILSPGSPDQINLPIASVEIVWDRIVDFLCESEKGQFFAFVMNCFIRNKYSRLGTVSPLLPQITIVGIPDKENFKLEKITAVFGTSGINRDFKAIDYAPDGGDLLKELTYYLDRWLGVYHARPDCSKSAVG